MKFRHSFLWYAGLLGICLFFAGGCGLGSSSPAQNPDYRNVSMWLSLPSQEKAVDVFYVYPTVSSNPGGNMDILSEDERILAQGMLQAQASLFEGEANLFVPYYRQMSTKVVIPEEQVATDTPEFKQGAEDVARAFDYYIEKLNEGRPFILAGHSQGTMALIELVKSRFGKSEKLRSLLVAAYFIGYTVTDEDLRTAGLEAARGADDTGVVITYNTQSPTSTGGPMLMAGAHCTNPLNWKTDATYAPAEENRGARFYNDATGEFLREVPQYCDAWIDLDTGALLTTIPEGESLDIGPFPEGVYHRYDYAFWYRNLEENVQVRIQAFLEQ